MRTMRWSVVALLGMLLAACGPEEEVERPPDAPMMQPGNPASEGGDAPVAPDEGAGDTP